MSNETLEYIRRDAVKVGYPKAIRDFLCLPEVPEEQLKEAAIRKFSIIPTGFYDQSFIERVWISAYEDVMRRKMFEFPEMECYVTKNPDP